MNENKECYLSNSALSAEAHDRIREIHTLSAGYNKKMQRPHQEQLLELLRKHIVEIEELFKKNDPHAIIETGDLLILGFELLLENNASIDNILQRCFERYEIKLTHLLRETEVNS